MVTSTMVTEEESAELTKRHVSCITMVAEEELRRRNVFLAKVAHKAKRYDDMRKFMDNVGVNVGPQELTIEERDLLFGAYKGVIEELRKARTCLRSFEETIAITDTYGRERAGEYREKIEGEMKSFCDIILHLLDTRLIPYSQTAEINVLYLKMRSDFLRYRAEMRTGDSVEEANEVKAAYDEVKKAYTSARNLASEKLNPTHPTRLGIALNLSVFHNDIMRQPEEALTLAKEAFDIAVGEIVDQSDDVEYIEETKHLIQLLRDIDNIWTSNMQNEKE